MKAGRMLLCVCFLCVSSLGKPTAPGESFPGVVVLDEPDFPAVDAPKPAETQLKALFGGANFATAEQLPASLALPATRLLVLPYGSAFPETAWEGIHAFLSRGGNLLVLGGRPFTRAAYRDAAGWHVRDYSVRFIRTLLIDQYQITPASDGLKFETNRDLTINVPPFAWKRAFSPILHLSAVDLYQRSGSAGSIDARLAAAVWGTRDGRRMSVPLLQIDHLRNLFTGGRWIFLSADMTDDFYGSAAAQQLIPELVKAAGEGSAEFAARTTLPLYLPGEPIEVELTWEPAVKQNATLTAEISVSSEQGPSRKITVTVPASQPLILPAPASKGLHLIDARLLEGTRIRAIARTGFWIRDEAYLQSGPRLTVNRDYFEIDGHPLAVVGTTYMASDVQRLFFEHPNLYVWDRDLDQISAAGLNMIRTGWWTGWEKFCDETGQPYERTLRTLEAFLMTARKHGLPVQFNFFAFLPEVLGGSNAYLDPDAVRKQQRLVSSVVRRFRNVPFLAWDLINEPSISQHLWRTRPNGDPIELQRWNEWLRQRYPDRAALAAAWNLPVSRAEGMLPLPTENEFTPRSMYSGHNSLKLYDFYVFSQEVFATWTQGMRDAIRATGSQQPITVGQDEGGFSGRLSPAFFGPFVDFTTNHSWWENDSLLWDSLAAKQPGLPMLIQETGLQRELTLDELARRTPENEAELLERKVALSFVQGSGAIQWLWNSNAYMAQGNEPPIGALRPDATEKPEATVLREYARFAKAIQSHLREPQQPPIAVVTSQAAQYSVLQDFQLQAQRNSVRAMAYLVRQPLYLIAENQISKLGSPKLVVLPSAQALGESAWRTLLDYVGRGGNLLITGPVERDEHWQRASRAAAVNLPADVRPITFRNAEIHARDKAIPVSFDQQKQSWLESLAFKDGATLKDVRYGKGRVFWAAYPAELAEDLRSTAELYAYVVRELELRPPFDLDMSLSPGVLVFPMILPDSVLYVVVSESAGPSHVAVHDQLTGARFQFTLPSERAALALIRKSDGHILAKYGF